MKKLLALLLAMFMLFSLVACNKDKTEVEKPADADVVDEDVVDEDVPEEEVVEEEVVEEEVVEDEDVVDEEVVDEEDAEEGERLGYEDPKFYTFQGALVTTPNNWNPCSHETVDDGEVLSYLESSLYSFDFDMDHPEVGYVIKKEMAAEMPEDITKEYAGNPDWNVPEDAEAGYAYRIKLIDYAVWQDGTPITADTYVYSLQQMLDPKMQNKRADMWYSGGKILTGAKAYLYQGQTVPVSIKEFVTLNELESVEAYLEEHGEEMAKVNWANSFGEMYDAEKGEWVKEGFENAVVEAGVTINELHELFIEKVHGEWGEPEETAEQFFQEETFVDYTYPEISWDKVGLQKEDDYSILVFFDQPLTGFQFYWNFNGVSLLHEETFEASKKEDKDTGLITSSYGTSVENTMSYGPYILTKHQDDKVVEFERNEKWYGYHDENHKGLYQADRARLTIVKEAATRHQMFLKGQLEGYGLQPDEVEDYRGSDFIYYTLSQYTGCLNFNRVLSTLESREEKGINKSVLTLLDFRKALVWSIDREDFARATTAASSAGFGLLNLRYIADTEDIIPYREFDAAKETLLSVYGLEYGEGKDYETLDEAYAAMTGYDLDAARELFDKAYDEAIEQGLLKEGDKVVLDYYAAEDNEFVRKTYNYLKSNWEKAMKGTKFEGKFELNLDATAGNDFGKNFKNGLSDMMQAGWQGANFDPFYLISAYINPDYRYDTGLDTSQKFTLEIDGEELTMSIDDWYAAMMGSNPDHNFGRENTTMENRVKILAALEKIILEQYTSCPVTYGQSASLKSQKIEYFIEDFNELLGRGGNLDYLFFNYSDEEWEEYVKEQGGELDYK